MNEEAKNSGGGAATQGGIGFQNHVAAWVCVMMLAERPATPIGPAARPIYLRFETPEPTDDLLVGCSDGSHAFGQAKRNLNLSTASNSEFASVVEQFVRQYISTRNGSGPRPWQRPLNPLRDRLVLTTTNRASTPVRGHLRAVLDRVRGLVAGQPLSDSAVNQDEKEALEIVLGHIRRIWTAVQNENISEAEALGVLKLMYVVTLDVEADDAGEREALSLLAMAVVRRSGDEKAAWAQRADKRPNIRYAIDLEEVLVMSPGRSSELLALDESLERLKRLNERQSKIVELRFFGGMSEEEAGVILGVSARTVKRD